MRTVRAEQRLGNLASGPLAAGIATHELNARTRESGQPLFRTNVLSLTRPFDPDA